MKCPVNWSWQDLTMTLIIIFNVHSLNFTKSEIKSRGSRLKNHFDLDITLRTKFKVKVIGARRWYSPPLITFFENILMFPTIIPSKHPLFNNFRKFDLHMTFYDLVENIILNVKFSALFKSEVKSRSFHLRKWPWSWNDLQKQVQGQGRWYQKLTPFDRYNFCLKHFSVSNHNSEIFPLID